MSLSCFTVKLTSDDLYLLTNGTSKIWIMSVSLINGYKIEDPTMISNENRQVRFSVNGDYQVDTSSGLGQFSSPAPFKLLLNKLVLNNDTLDIRHLSADTLVLEITNPVPVNYPDYMSQEISLRTQLIFTRK